MKLDIKSLCKNRSFLPLLFIIAVIASLYFLISLYFITHYQYNTYINGIDVSLKAYDEVELMLKKHIDQYELELINRIGQNGKIKGKDIELTYNKKNSIYQVQYRQKPYLWIFSLIGSHHFVIGDLFNYNKYALKNQIDALSSINKETIEPQNVNFQYNNGSYSVLKEVYGNKINRQALTQAIINSVLKGNKVLDLDASYCYENPKYTLDSEKTTIIRDKLNTYTKSKIVYLLGSKREILDATLIHEWLRVDKNLDIIIDEQGIKEYVKALADKYNTMGMTRRFKASTGDTVEVPGGLYGWKINQVEEKKGILEQIQSGECIEREPIYNQRALSRDENDIGNTYVEINITKQHLWFYKDGKLLTHGPIVTGNVNRGHDTDLGTYMLNYKIKDATLKGEHYESKVKYWMPFYGNIGIHDTNWRHAFGGEIYKRNGSHGCVNTPLYLAQTVYEHIEPGIPIICYKE